jgi:hypothetical protein
MHAGSSLYCLFACVGVALAAATPPEGVRVDDDNAEELVPRPTAALGLFNKTVPVYATDDGKHYMVDVQLGWHSNASEAQVARLIIDTGSGDTVVFGALHCAKKLTAFNHQVADGRGCYDYRKSASFKFNVEGLGRRVNHECKYDEPGHQGAYCKEALLIDGYKAEVMCELAWEDASFAPAEPGLETGMQDSIRADICVVNDTDTANYKVRYWNNTQGTLGLFYHLCEPGQGEAKCQVLLALVPYKCVLLLLTNVFSYCLLMCSLLRSARYCKHLSIVGALLCV